MDEASEEWRPVVGYEGLYEVSSLGSVRGKDRTLSDGRHWRGKDIKAWIVGAGYRYVRLSKNGSVTPTGIHRLVCHAFHGDPPPGRGSALHWNGDPSDNRPRNLRWGSGSENQQDRIRHGRNNELNKTHCPHGHPYSPENTYIQPSTGQRICRTCKKFLNDKHNALAKARRRSRNDREHE